MGTAGGTSKKLKKRLGDAFLHYRTSTHPLLQLAWAPIFSRAKSG